MMNFSDSQGLEFSAFHGAQECDQASAFGGDFDFGHSCFTHYGCPSDMSDGTGRGRGRPSARVSSTASRIPRCAQSPRQTPPVAHSPRPNYSFRPIFHERSNHEDDQVLTQQLWKLARKSGTLNLSNKALARVPERLYDINEADAESKAANLEQLTIKEEDAWWNQVPLNNLDLSSNTLTHISPKIENLQSLTVLTLHDNALVELPSEIGKLEKLMRLNVSHNKLSQLPRSIYSLPELRHLNISYNEFNEIDPDISDLHMLEFLDGGHNNIQSLPGGIGFLVRLTALLLPYNHIKELPPDLVNMRSLQKIDLMQNDLTSLPEDMGLLRKLECLYLQHNDILELPEFEGNETLSELHASNNFIKTIPKAMCSNLPHLKILDLRDNKITELPDELCLLRNLNRLDVSNNTISVLPNTLSSLAHLISLQVEGNPIKTIRRDILQCGTARILKTLHERALAKAKEEGGGSDSASTLPGISVTRLRGGQSDAADMPGNFPDSSYHQQQHQQDGFQYQCPYSCHQQMQQHCCVYEPLRNCREYDRQTQGHIYEPESYQQQHPMGNMRSLFVQQQQQRVESPHRNYFMCQQQQLTQFSYGQHDSSHLAVNPRWIYKLRHTRTLAVNLEELTQVPDQVFQIARDEGVHVVDFARNQLSTLPNGLQLMHDLVSELVLSNNLIGYVPQFISQFTRISYLNLSNNLLNDLPNEFGVLNSLRELNIANNRFQFIPNCVYELQGLEILIASENHIKTLNVSGLQSMPRLSTLDLRNNDIDTVPPTLGNLTNITHLELIGNPFRQPRHQILMKGTDAIMSYLRDRIPT
ncbi:leucine-rich repeat-containing protein 40 isoform X1 [Drosophila biarmipes]|uniref:leucine-rich repeat-containing protein 40 isoform X1 n=1 Tax=Drosophila biarmipes TaxID=125945 RepID=UPI0021CCA147|nr:leucine-rich repeat-containing protein 40 isoform X1 [Drosophila biarmipes]